MAKANDIKQSDKGEKAHIMTPFEEMEKRFSSMFHRSGLFPLLERPHLWENWSLFEGKMPSVDMIDKKDKIIIKAELPGVDKKDIDVSVTDHTLTIKGTTSTDEEEEKGDYYRHEISAGSFERVLVIPANVDTENVKAKFRNGVLKLTLPKTDKASNNTKVSVE